MPNVQKGVWRSSVQLGFATTLVAAACCNALLPVRVDSFALFPLSHGMPCQALPGGALRGGFAPTHRDAGSLHFGLRLRGGECGEEDTRAPRLFAVEGLIGAGKSTLLAKLRAQEGVAIIPEPLERWQETGIFEAFYKDMTRWSFTFQMAAFVSRVQAAEKALKDASDSDDPARVTSLVGERSWYIY